MICLTILRATARAGITYLIFLSSDWMMRGSIMTSREPWLGSPLVFYLTRKLGVHGTSWKNLVYYYYNENLYLRLA